MKRRDFLKQTTAAAGAAAVIPALAGDEPEEAPPERDVLRGFIVSDAHFGWQNPQQPGPDVQHEMMQRILDQFPELDLFIDTGDAHHGGANDEARGLWTDIIPGQCRELPFFYIAGNHEIVPTCGLDPEWRCNTLGSVSCRPYYSFDLKGIHFIALPEMKRTVLVTRETVEWLLLDLEVHKDRTTIILTHNSILGITCLKGEYGYRGLVNSREMVEIMDRYPNVIAWMNGHNHTYEIEKQDGRLYVSNGRIGGFIPPAHWGHVGQGHLGGIYFEITRQGLTALCYSATEEEFLHKLGETHLQGTLEVDTTLDPDAAPSYCYGYGGARDGQRIPVIHHHAYGQKPAEVFLRGADDPSFNEDPEFALSMVRQNARLGPHHQLMAGTVQLNEQWGEMWVKNTVYEWLDPGIRFLARPSSEESVRMSVPLIQHGKATYYRCPPGRKYRASLDLETEKGGQTLQLEFLLHDRNNRQVASVRGPLWTLKEGKHVYAAEVKIPDLPEVDCIYSDPEEDNTVHLMVLSEFKNLMDDVVLHRFDLAFADAEGATKDPALLIDGLPCRHQGELGPEEIVRFEIQAPASSRTVFEPRAEGNRRLTWLVRHPAPQWQVRNAPVADRGGFLEIGPRRNTFSERQEIIIVPMKFLSEPYVHKLRGVEKARVYPLSRENRFLRIEILETAYSPEVEVLCEAKPAEITGTERWKRIGNRLILGTEAGAVLELAFGL